MWRAPLKPPTLGSVTTLLALVDSSLGRPRLAAYAAIGALLLLVTVLLPATGAFALPESGFEVLPTAEGTIVSIVETERLETANGTVVSEQIELALDGGERTVVERTRRLDDFASIDVEPGDLVLLSASETPEGTRYFISDHLRRFPLWILALVFAAVVLAIGRWHGLASLIGLAASFLVIVRFIVPAILSGADPLTISIAGSLVIMTTTLFLAHGVNWKTLVALGGTTAALLLTALLAGFAIGFARLTGIATDEAATLQILSTGTIDARGLLLGGIIIGALGVLDDVTMAQASSVFELRRANPLLAAGELYRRGMRVGRDHIASTVNTLVLAYAGASLPLLIILASGSEPLGVLINRDVIATEVVRTLVGSIGIVAAVPITTLLAGLAAAHLGPEELEEAHDRTPS